MGEPGGDLDLAQEPIGPQARGQVWAEYLESDRPAVFQVLRQIDGRHAPAADLAFDPIALCERDLEVAEQTAHTAQRYGGGLGTATVSAASSAFRWQCDARPCSAECGPPNVRA